MSKKIEEEFDEWLRTFWMDNTKEEAMAIWKSKLAMPGITYPTEVQQMLEEIVSNPPKDLVERIQQNGWVFLEDESWENYLNWLKRVVEEFKSIGVN